MDQSGVHRGERSTSKKKNLGILFEDDMILTFTLSKLHRPKEGLGLILKKKGGRGGSRQDSSLNLYNSTKVIFVKTAKAALPVEMVASTLIFMQHRGGGTQKFRKEGGVVCASPKRTRRHS